MNLNKIQETNFVLNSSVKFFPFSFFLCFFCLHFFPLALLTIVAIRPTTNINLKTTINLRKICYLLSLNQNHMVYNKLKWPVFYFDVQGQSFTDALEKCFSKKLHKRHKKTSLWDLFYEVVCLELATLLKRKSGTGVFLWILWYFSENHFAEH